MVRTRSDHVRHPLVVLLRGIRMRSEEGSSRLFFVFLSFSSPSFFFATCPIFLLPQPLHPVGYPVLYLERFSVFIKSCAPSFDQRRLVFPLPYVSIKYYFHNLLIQRHTQSSTSITDGDLSSGHMEGEGERAARARENEQPSR